MTSFRCQTCNSLDWAKHPRSIQFVHLYASASQGCVGCLTLCCILDDHSSATGISHLPTLHLLGAALFIDADGKPPAFYLQRKVEILVLTGTRHFYALLAC